MSGFMSDRTPEEQRYVRLQMLVYDILAAEDGKRLATPQMVDGFVDAILSLDAVGGRCQREGGCVCGGDTPGIRAGCENWSRT